MVGLAACALQLVEFALRILQSDHEIYVPKAGASVDHDAILRVVTHELHSLTEKIDEQKAKKSSTEKKGSKFDEATQQLHKSSERTREFTSQLIDGFEQAREKYRASGSPWTTLKEALLLAWEKGMIIAHKKRYQLLRKEFDVALLRALKYVGCCPTHRPWYAYTS